MERINLVRSERSRELSRANKSLYEFLHPEEQRPATITVINHAVIKADVRGSTGITKDLLARGLNPASHFSMNLHEPVKRMLERYGAAKVFIEGDAIILAIYETESTRATQRAVARACVLAREILAVTQAYNVARENKRSSAARTWRGRRLSGFGAVALDGRGFAHHDFERAESFRSPFELLENGQAAVSIERQRHSIVYLLQTLMERRAEDEGDELLVRYNLNGIELNEEGFQKLSAEISLAPMAGTFPLPWGKERVQLYFGELPLGESLEPIVIRKGFVRQLLPGGKMARRGPARITKSARTRSCSNWLERSLPQCPRKNSSASRLTVDCTLRYPAISLPLLPFAEPQAFQRARVRKAHVRTLHGKISARDFLRALRGKPIR